jgi:YHS domain-containing protein
MSAPIVYDVVCGMSAPLGEWDSKAEYNGKTYYFCRDGCKGASRTSACLTSILSACWAAIHC